MATRSTIKSQIALDIADNGAGSITPAKDKAIRDSIADSYANLTDELITQAAALTGTDTSPKLITAAILKAAIEAIGVANQSFQDLLTANGLSENDTNFGSFTGGVLSNSATAKTLFQELATAVNNVSGGNGLMLAPVADITARNALSGLVVGNTVKVDDDGDSLWAIYQVSAAGDGTGANATWVKIADENALENAISAAAIRSVYLSNSGTEEFTTALQTKLNSITVGEAGYILNYANTGAAPTSGVATGSRTFIAGELYEFDGTNWVADTADLTGLGADIIAEIDSVQGDTEWRTKTLATGTGTALDLSLERGTAYNTYASPSNATAYTVTNPTNGGWASVIINAPSQPSVTSTPAALHKGGDVFEVNTDFEMIVSQRNGEIIYYFVKSTTPA